MVQLGVVLFPLLQEELSHGVEDIRWIYLRIGTIAHDSSEPAKNGIERSLVLVLKVCALLIVERVEEDEVGVDGVGIIELVAERCDSIPGLPSHKPCKEDELKGHHKLHIMYLEEDPLGDLGNHWAPVSPEDLDADVQLPALPQYELIHQLVDELGHLNDLLQVRGSQDQLKSAESIGILVGWL